jgi:hypothetical protein
VSLWFVLRVARKAQLNPDPREYKDVRWFHLDEQRDWPACTYDPEMHRFAEKLTGNLKENLKATPSPRGSET